MKLRTKTILFVVLVVAFGLGGITIGARAVVLSYFDQLEHEALLRTTDQTKSIVLTMVEEFQLRGLDWSDWDDMATYLGDGNDAFREANLTADGLASCGWDHAVVVKEDGERVFTSGRDREAHTLIKSAPELKDLIDRRVLNPKSDATVAGLARIQGHIHLVASRPIRLTDHSDLPIKGRFVTTRLIDDAWIERLRKFTFLDVRFHPLFEDTRSSRAAQARADLGKGAPTVAYEQDESHYAGFTRLSDVEGHPLLDLEIQAPRHLRSAAEKMASTAVRFGSLAGVAAALLCGVFMGQLVLRPLSRILEGVRRLEGGERVAVAVQSRDELGQLAGAFNGMVQVISDREDALRLVLDSTGEGLAIIDFEGRVEGQVSASARQWFGAPEGRLLWQWFGADPLFARAMELNLEQVADGFLPFEAAIDQLPKTLCQDQITFRLEYKGVWKGEQLERLLVVINDATEALAAERVEQEGRELEAVVRNELRERHSVAAFLEENGPLVTRLEARPDLVEAKRLLHTLKGNTAIFGLESVAQATHQAETALEEGEALGSALIPVLDAWGSARTRIEGVFGHEEHASIELGEVEYQRFLTVMMERTADQELLDTVRRWKNAPARVVLGRFARQIEGLARRLGKDVTVQVNDPGCRLPRADLSTFFGTVIHVVRNAVDHGIEPAAERNAKGKPTAGRIELSVGQQDGAFVFEIKDDGRGIDWESVKLKAEAAGLPADTTTDLERALFADGLSTRAEVSETSGRGVGLGAVQEVCRSLGGQVKVQSRGGLGTSFRFHFPVRTGSTQGLAVPADLPRPPRAAVPRATPAPR